MRKTIKKIIIPLYEIKINQKNGIVAGVLAIGFGYFGAHRFYLGRKMSGIIYALVSISSIIFGNGVLLLSIYIISIIEGIIYFSFGISRGYKELKLNCLKLYNKIKLKYRDSRKIETIKNALKNFFFDEKELYSDQENQISDLDDKSKLHEDRFVVPTKKESQRNHKLSIDLRVVTNEGEIKNKDLNKSWIQKLEIPSDHNVIKLDLINEESLSIYEVFCETTDDLLRKIGSSLDRERNKLRNISNNHDVLYTLYCLAVGFVTEAYNNGIKYYNYDIHLENIKDNLGEKVQLEIEKLGKVLVEDLPPADIETIKFFREYNKKLTDFWWDADKNIRNKDLLTEQEIWTLNLTDYRETLVWNYFVTKELVLSLYIQLWHLIMEHVEDDILESLTDPSSGYENKQFFNSLLKISENSINHMFKSFDVLDVSFDEKYVRSFISIKVYRFLESHIFKYQRNISRDKVMEALREVIEDNPHDLESRIQYYLMLEDGNVIDDFNTLIQRDEAVEIVKKILIETDHIDKRLLGLSFLYFEKVIDSNSLEELKTLIHESNWHRFENLVENTNNPSVRFFEEIIIFKLPYRKRVNLDPYKIEESKKELEEIVSFVDDFIGSDGSLSLNKEEETIQDDKEFSDINLDISSEDFYFLNQLIKDEQISIDHVKSLAVQKGMLVNAFINAVNKKLYEYVGDQTVIIENNVVKIDDYYIEDVKELIQNEK